MGLAQVPRHPRERGPRPRQPVSATRMGFGLAPSEVRLATLVLLVLSQTLGVAVLVSNYRTWRAKPKGHDLHSSLLSITSALAVASMLSGLMGFFGPKSILHVESVYASREIIGIQAPDLSVAVMFVVLTGLATSLDALLTWQCYVMGKTIRSEPIPKWKTVLVHMYIWLLNFVLWTLEHTPTHVWMRKTPFHKKLSIHRNEPHASTVIALAALIAVFLIHLTFSFVFVVVFMRSLHHLTQQIHVLDAQLAVKSIVYVCASLALYLVAWGLFLLYPRNLQADVSSTPYLLSLLVLMELCFVVNLRLPCRGGPAAAPPEVAVEMGAAMALNAAEEVKEQGVILSPRAQLAQAQEMTGYNTQSLPMSASGMHPSTASLPHAATGSYEGAAAAAGGASGGNMGGSSGGSGSSDSPVRRRRPIVEHWRELFSARSMYEGGQR